MTVQVCLSLLGTWAGPSWDPVNSSVLQVLVSLQGMVFCQEPWFNEPGYERERGTSAGDTKNATHNAGLREKTAQHAMMAPIRVRDTALLLP